MEGMMTERRTRAGWLGEPIREMTAVLTCMGLLAVAAIIVAMLSI
jgi:hypothetical protein